MILSVVLFVSFPLGVKSEEKTVLERVKSQGFIRVGMREDAVPFGYRDLNNNLSGICLDFINLLREKLKEDLDLQVITIKLYRSTLFNRFDLVADGLIDVECGPNTITNNREGVTFSKPFFVTGTQFLVPTENHRNFHLNQSNSQIKLGVLRGTTTEEIIEQRYPRATLQKFQGVNGRLRGVQAVQKGIIDGFASDGILLIGEATLLGLAIPRDYTIVPSLPLDCSYYGLILPADDPEWRNLVDSVISGTNLRTLLRRWFTIVSPYIRESISFCTSN